MTQSTPTQATPTRATSTQATSTRATSTQATPTQASRPAGKPANPQSKHDDAMRFLLVDADDAYVSHLSTLIQACCPDVVAIDRANSAREALALIDRHFYDICFMEYSLANDSSGLDILRAMVGTTSLTALIMLTSVTSKTAAFEALGLGAMDYLIKDRFTGFELAKCVSYSIYRKRKEVSLQKDSLRDSLTGLGNRNLFDAQLKQAAMRAERDSENLGVLVIDVDGFKKINDRYGHKEGDLLLQQISERIVKQTRSSDVVARIGGDEFAAILIKPKSADDIYNVAEKIEKAISGSPYNLNGKVVKVAASVGSAILPDDTKNLDDLFRFADMRMYKNKKVKKAIIAKGRDYMDTVLR